MNNETQKPSKKNGIIGLILSLILFRFITNLFKKRKDIFCNFKKFFKAEKQEIIELEAGKKSLKNYFSESYSIFHEYFIPSPRNDHKPKILRTRSLVIITIISTIIKIVVISYLFFIYPNQGLMSEIIVKKVFELTNQSRIANNLPALTMNSVLATSAEAKGNDMIANNYFAHYSPAGKSPWGWISRKNYPYIFVGENLAMNFTSADAVHTALMNSPSHKKNILNERYTDMGLAMISGKIDGSDTNVLVELFGTTGNTVKPASAPESTESTKVTTAISKPVEEKVEKVNVLASEKNVETAKPVVKPVQKIEAPKPAPVTKVIAKKTTAPVTSSSMRQENKIIAMAKPVEKVTEVAPVSPNEELEKNPTPSVTYVTPEEDMKFGIATTLIKGSNYIYLGLFVFMVLLLLVNIFVHFSVQHKPVIFQTLLVIVFIFSLASVKVHILESVMSGIALL